MASPDTRVFWDDVASAHRTMSGGLVSVEEERAIREHDALVRGARELGEKPSEEEQRKRDELRGVKLAIAARVSDLLRGSAEFAQAAANHLLPSEDLPDRMTPRNGLSFSIGDARIEVGFVSEPGGVLRSMHLGVNSESFSLAFADLEAERPSKGVTHSGIVEGKERYTIGIQAVAKSYGTISKLEAAIAKKG